jgi:ribulose-phosphate 3-epimerase
MAVICPTVTEYDMHAYRQRMEQIQAFADRVHIDLMDGVFATTKSPDLSRIWWSPTLSADIHLMYQQPADQLEQLIKLKPRLVVIHAEADVNHMDFAARLHRADILAGLALLQDTTVNSVEQIIHSFDHVLVFSGKLGHHRGVADLSLLSKVREIRASHPDAEISWDGGVNDQNARQLVEAGVDVLNVGGFIDGADDPVAAYAKLGTVIKGR